MDKWRRAEGVDETMLPSGLEPIVRSAGHIWKHDQQSNSNLDTNSPQIFCCTEHCLSRTRVRSVDQKSVE